MAIAEQKEDLPDVVAPPAAPPDAPPAPALQGRVDALENGRVYGWVWHPERKGERIEVLIRSGALTVGRELADKQRIDLRRNGIGDGNHAFDIALPASAAEAPDRLSVLAIDPATGARQELRIPSQTERSAEAAASKPFNMILDRLDVVIAAQHQIQLAHRNDRNALGRTAERIEGLSGLEERLEGSFRTVEEGQQALAERLRELEVFLVRYDGALGELGGRMEKLTEHGSGVIRPHLLLLSVATGFIAGIAACAGFGL